MDARIEPLESGADRSQMLCDMIGSMLQRDPKHRPTAAVLLWRLSRRGSGIGHLPRVDIGPPAESTVPPPMPPPMMLQRRPSESKSSGHGSSDTDDASPLVIPIVSRRDVPRSAFLQQGSPLIAMVSRTSPPTVTRSKTPPPMSTADLRPAPPATTGGRQGFRQQRFSAPAL